MGYGPGNKGKKKIELISQLNSAIKEQTKLQMQGILQQDSLDKIAGLSFDTAFKNRHREVQINLFKQEKELGYLREKAMTQK